MDPIHEKFLNRMKEFEQTHTKVDLPEHREKIKNLYEDFTLIFDEFSSTIEETEEEKTKKKIKDLEERMNANKWIYRNLK